MATWTSIWQPAAPALLAAALITAPVDLDLQQGLAVLEPEAHARGPSRGGPGDGPGDARGDGLGGRDSAGDGAASAARGDGLGGRGGAADGAASAGRGDALGGRGGPGDHGLGRFSNQGTLGEVGRAPVHDEQSLATARERYNRALGATTEIAAKANAGPGQEFDTAQAVFVFGEEATEVLIQAGWVAPGAKADRAFANHGQKVSTYVSIAKALGHSAHIGVLQANFGRDESASGPEGDWRDVNLDVNGDRIVDEEDLRSAKLRQVTR